MNAGPHAFIVLLLIASSIPALASPAGIAPPGPGCPSIEHVDGLGPACLQEDGLWRVHRDDGSVIGTTHGLDESHTSGASFDDAHPRTPYCVDNPVKQRHAQLVYAYPFGEQSQLTDREAAIRSAVDWANGVVHDRAAQQGGTLDLRIRCIEEAPEILEVQVPGSQVTFSHIVDALEAEGLDRAIVKYWILFDNLGASWAGGVANLDRDDGLGVNSAHNHGPDYAITFYQDWLSEFQVAEIMLHELSHTMGAVQRSAPHFYDNGGGWHCWDEEDVMCYGPSTLRLCIGGVVYDCGGDDYFNALPEPLSYLDLHWNIAHPFNRFTEGCLDTQVTLDDPTSEASLPGVSSARVEIPVACQGSLFALFGAIRPLPGAPIFGNFRWIEQPFAVCWEAEGDLLGCDAATPDGANVFTFSTHGRVPGQATHAQIRLEVGGSIGGPTKVTLRAT